MLQHKDLKAFFIKNQQVRKLLESLLLHNFSHHSAMWVIVWVWFFIAPKAQNLYRYETKD